MTATIVEVAIELARPTPSGPQADQWQAWINRAYLLVLNRLGQDAYDALDPALLDDVVKQAVAEHVRAWRETTASSYTVSVDDGSTTRRYDGGVGPLSISDTLWRLLDPTIGDSTAFTIAPSSSTYVAASGSDWPDEWSQVYP